MHVNKVTVALAAKIARVAWVILTRPGAIYDRRIPAEASDSWPADCEVRGCDDETVDRRCVSPSPKAGHCPMKLCGNMACGSHHGLAATAAHSREAGYI